MSRRKAREVAFKVLFQIDQVKADPRRAFDYLKDLSNLPLKDQDFSWTLVEGCVRKMSELDSIIGKLSKAWTLDRMSSVDRNLLRLAGFEILYVKESQPAVAIDEAIEISKRYGEEHSAAFINAILDKMTLYKGNGVSTVREDV